jgi:hypothetical protein
MDTLKSMCPDSVVYLYDTLSSEPQRLMLHAQMKYIKDKSELFVDLTDVFQQQKTNGLTVGIGNVVWCLDFMLLQLMIHCLSIILCFYWLETEWSFVHWTNQTIDIIEKVSKSYLLHVFIVFMYHIKQWCFIFNGSLSIPKLFEIPVCFLVITTVVK